MGKYLMKINIKMNIHKWIIKTDLSRTKGNLGYEEKTYHWPPFSALEIGM